MSGSKGNSFSNGNSAYNGSSHANGQGPASRIITGERLGGEHWWYFP